MSYASCLNNTAIGKQTIKDLTITGSFSNISNNIIQVYTIEALDNIQSNVTTQFYSQILAVGSYSIRGTVTIQPLSAPLYEFSITESSTSNKFPLYEQDYTSIGGLQGSQSLPFSTFYVSDGVKPLTFSVYLTGETEFSIRQADRSLEIFKIA